jgi:hypothetical protein
MENGYISNRWRPGLILALVYLLIALVAAPALAADKTWHTYVNDWWDIGTNWNPNGQPQAGDNVNIVTNLTNDIDVWYRNTTNPTATLGTLFINNYGTGMVTLNQGYGGYNNELHFYNEVIGGYYYGSTSYSGNGTYTQSNGLNAATEICVGCTKGSKGYYNLSGGTVTSTTMNVGVDTGSTGIFSQSGGTISTTNSLYISVLVLLR